MNSLSTVASSKLSHLPVTGLRSCASNSSYGRSTISAEEMYGCGRTFSMALSEVLVTVMEELLQPAPATNPDRSPLIAIWRCWGALSHRPSGGTSSEEDPPGVVPGSVPVSFPGLASGAGLVWFPARFPAPGFVASPVSAVGPPVPDDPPGPVASSGRADRPPCSGPSVFCGSWVCAGGLGASVADAAAGVT
ncbi:hypothetical protein ADK74_12855 [Streptomyces decoyicus]|nr:hypothetical protein ADK74_12855 [Streptomyces decoyicus]